MKLSANLPLLCLAGFVACKKQDVKAPGIAAADESTATSSLTITLTATPNYYTPLVDTIYIAGSFNDWAPGDPAWRLKPNARGQWQIRLNQPAGTTIEYKFTRGSWATVETKPNGSFQPNRSYTFTQTQTRKNLEIGDWQDQLGNHTATGLTRIVDMDFFIPELNRYRRIWVYLPGDYFSTNKRFPTLYMHDGQNLMDASRSAFGEWRCDETMQNLEQKDSTDGVIIVGVDNGEGNRINEYSPWRNSLYGGGQGDEYMDFIVTTLKPWIDSRFRTLPDRNNTGLMGSSMGGLISWYGGLTYQEVFSKVGVFSPSFWFSPQVDLYASSTNKEFPTRFYFTAGGQEGASVNNDIVEVRNAMSANGFTEDELKYVLVPNGSHTESFWASQFDDAILWLY
jgi:predicted alpha/beta superfamily hydrolase